MGDTLLVLLIWMAVITIGSTLNHIRLTRLEKMIDNHPNETRNADKIRDDRNDA